MITVPSPYQLRQWQLDHYSKRLAEEKTTEGKMFLREQLWRFKKQIHDESFYI